MRRPIQQMSRAVVGMLLGQIERPAPTHERLVFQPQLVVRGSTGPAGG
jgi:LacI family transcriptional regulator, repressor for deo operon, udp, cdd, tsx, nupC, and nupG